MKGETLLFLLWHCPFYIGVYGSWLTFGVSLKWPLEELQLLALQHWLWHSAPEIAACSKHYWFELNVRKLMSNVVYVWCPLPSDCLDNNFAWSQNLLWHFWELMCGNFYFLCKCTFIFSTLEVWVMRQAERETLKPKVHLKLDELLSWIISTVNQGI